MQVGRPELTGADEPTYVNLAQVREEMSALSGIKEEERQPEGQSNGPGPGEAEVPPPAPRRTKSVRPNKSPEVNSRPTGSHSGYNSGASGDGVVIHKRKTGASGVKVVTPMGSSSESEYSGDGKVQRSDIVTQVDYQMHRHAGLSRR